MKMRENPTFFVVLLMKNLESTPAAEGGGIAIRFSAEIMMNRAIWQINEYFVFGVIKKG